MAGILFQEVKTHSRATGTARALLLILADYAGFPDGHCFPKEATLAADLNVCRRQVKRYIRRLEDMGELHVIRKPGRQNTYIVPRLEGAPPRDGRQTPTPAAEEDTEKAMWADFWYWVERVRRKAIHSQQDYSELADDFAANYLKYVPEIATARMLDEQMADMDEPPDSPRKPRGRPRKRGGAA